MLGHEQLRHIALRERTLIAAAATAIVALCGLFYAANALAVIGGNPPGVHSYLASVCGGSISPDNQTRDLATESVASFEIELRKNVREVSTVSEADRACDEAIGSTAPAENVEIRWVVTHGPCAGLFGSTTSNDSGLAQVSFSGCAPGTDAVLFSIVKRFREIIRRDIILTTYQCVETDVDGACLDWVRVDKPQVSTSDNVISERVVLHPKLYKVIWENSLIAPPLPDAPNTGLASDAPAPASTAHALPGIAWSTRCGRSATKLIVRATGDRIEKVWVGSRRQSHSPLRMSTNRDSVIFLLTRRTRAVRIRVLFEGGSTAAKTARIAACRA